MSIIAVGSVAFDSIATPSGRVENVFEKFQPQIPEEYKDSEFLFLGNIHPHLQAAVRLELPDVKLTGGDTMNFWIQGANQELIETLRLVNILLINDTEVKMLAKDSSLPRAARKVITMGPQASQPELNREVIKRALFYGGVMGSFAVERFGTERLQSLTRGEIDARFQLFRELTHLE